MEQKVKWSRYAWLMTILVTVALIVALILTRDTAWRFYLIIGVTAVVFISMWIWSPTAISVDDEFLTIHKRIGSKRIQISDIQSIRLFLPEVERGFRLCGSGGFAGYYGWYSDSRIGSYFGYYGNRQQCFLLCLKSGKQYIIGCENVPDMIEYIKNKMN